MGHLLAPGPDGFPAEFYRTYAEELAPKFHSMLLSSLREGALPASMSEAVIVVIPKPGKDPELCKSYCPISLIDVDAKLLAKILATRLNGVITALVHHGSIRLHARQRNRHQYP